MSNDLVKYADDPRRCQGTTTTGQCRNYAMEGTEYCKDCAGNSARSLKAKSTFDYKLTDPRFAERYKEISLGDNVRSLQKEINLMRMLLEHTYNEIADDTTGRSKIAAAQLGLAIQKLESQSQILEQNSGLLLHRSTVVKFVKRLIQIVYEEVRDLPGGIDAADRVADRCESEVRGTRNETVVRGSRVNED